MVASITRLVVPDTDYKERSLRRRGEGEVMLLLLLEGEGVFEAHSHILGGIVLPSIYYIYLYRHLQLET